MISFFLSAPRIKGLLIALAALSVLLLAMGAGLAVQTARLGTAKAELAAERVLSALFKTSAENAGKSVAALQDQLAALDASRLREQEQAAKREKVFHDVKQVPPESAGVVDAETSRKAVEHVNETLSRRTRF